MDIIKKDGQVSVAYTFEEQDAIEAALAAIKTTGSVDSEESAAKQNEFLSLYYPVLKEIARLQFDKAHQSHSVNGLSGEDFIASAYRTAVIYLVKYLSEPNIESFNKRFAYAVKTSVASIGLNDSNEVASDEEIEVPLRKTWAERHAVGANPHKLNELLDSWEAFLTQTEKSDFVFFFNSKGEFSKRSFGEWHKGMLYDFIRGDFSEKQAKKSGIMGNIVDGPFSDIRRAFELFLEKDGSEENYYSRKVTQDRTALANAFIEICGKDIVQEILSCRSIFGVRGTDAQDPISKMAASVAAVVIADFDRQYAHTDNEFDYFAFMRFFRENYIDSQGGLKISKSFSVSTEDERMAR